MKAVISAQETGQLIAEAMATSTVFADKMTYWFRQRKTIPSQKWLLENLCKALTQDRIAVIIGRALTDAQESDKS
jgi:hypothetical protein